MIVRAARDLLTNHLDRRIGKVPLLETIPQALYRDVIEQLEIN
jgi:hypothetical protein